LLLSCALCFGLVPSAQSAPAAAGLRDLASIRVLENGDVLLQVPFSNAFADPEVCSATSVNFPLKFHVDGCTANSATGGIGVPIVVSIETQG
jgi:hypothetical protein